MNAMRWPSTKWMRLLKLAVLGGVAFWLPDVLLHAFRGYNFNGRDVRIVTIICPLTMLIVFLVASWTDKANPPKSVFPALVAGVWLLGGLFMLVGASFAGGGLLAPDGARGAMFWILLSLVPIYTFIMATYDGALAALLLVTAFAVPIWLVERSGILLRFSGPQGIRKL
ncbi:MAG: hypothetical protein WAL95_18495 [Candidatus Acidiferrales bacterium]